MSADGKPACGRTRILTDSSRKRNRINYACPNFQATCAMALMFTLQQFELSTLPSIPSNGHVGGLCNMM
jgi:hypothetical protein